MAQPYIKCRYCDWYTLRLRGKKPGAGALEAHVIAAHQQEFVAAVGCTSLQEYLDRLDSEEEWLHREEA